MGKLPVKKTVIFPQNIRRPCREHLKRRSCHNFRIADQRQRFLGRESDLHIVKNQRRHPAYKPIHRGRGCNQQEGPSCDVAEIPAKIIDCTCSYRDNNVRFLIISHCNAAKGVFICCQVAVLRALQDRGHKRNLRLSKHLLRLFACNLIRMSIADQIRPGIAKLGQKLRQSSDCARLKNKMGKQGFMSPPTVTLKSAVQILLDPLIFHKILLFWD